MRNSLPSFLFQSYFFLEILEIFFFVNFFFYHCDKMIELYIYILRAILDKISRDFILAWKKRKNISYFTLSTLEDECLVYLVLYYIWSIEIRIYRLPLMQYCCDITFLIICPLNHNTLLESFGQNAPNTRS